MNKCTCSKDSECALGIFWIEKRLVLTCFPSRTRTVLFPLVGDLSRLLRMEKWLTWFLLAVPKSQYSALTLHFLSLVLSDCHLIQPGRSNPQLSACTENWGFDRQVFGGNYLHRECTEQHSATKLFDVSTQIRTNLEKLWRPLSACQNIPLCMKHFGFSEVQKGVWETVQCHSSQTPCPSGWCTCDGWLRGEGAVCPWVPYVLPNRVHLSVRLEVIRSYGLVTASIPHFSIFQPKFL